jgi:hypothetical protein
MSRWKGTVVDNLDVAATIRKHGAPAHSKPHGIGKTILYYENPDADPNDDSEPVKDYAGTRTPGTRGGVTHTTGPGLAVRTAVDTRPLEAASLGRTGISDQGRYENPNDKFADVEVSGPVDSNVVMLEGKRREEGEDEDAALIASTAESSREEVIEDLGSDSTATLEGEEAGDSEPTLETPEASTNKVDTFDPRGSYQARYPDRNYEKLDVLTKAELDRMYQEDKDLLGEIKGTGEGGNVLKNDYISILRTDK